MPSHRTSEVPNTPSYSHNSVSVLHTPSPNVALRGRGLGSTSSESTIPYHQTPQSTKSSSTSSLPQSNPRPHRDLETPSTVWIDLTTDDREVKSAPPIPGRRNNLPNITGDASPRSKREKPRYYALCGKSWAYQAYIDKHQATCEKCKTLLRGNQNSIPGLQADESSVSSDDSIRIIPQGDKEHPTTSQPGVNKTTQEPRFNDDQPHKNSDEDHSLGSQTQRHPQVSPTSRKRQSDSEQSRQNERSGKSARRSYQGAKSTPSTQDEPTSPESESQALVIFSDVEDTESSEESKKFDLNDLGTTLLEFHMRIRKVFTSELTSKDEYGYIYVFSSEKDHLLKIGRSKDTLDRKSDIQYKCGLKLKIIDEWSVEYYKRTEKLIHAELADCRHLYHCICGTQHGEWFDIDKKLALTTTEKWAMFMRTRAPYAERKLGPFWKQRVNVLKNKFPTDLQDYELVRQHWTRILSASFLDIIRSHSIWNALWVHRWPISAVFGWITVSIFVPNRATWIIMAVNLAAMFVRTTGLGTAATVKGWGKKK
ncbi:hypothetical protein IQ07DRAFT_602553 [Pyrenochaeta sp. DS3sAY3a]|nr:hypothetical protein IQ07DRAFT_602553 [Pyrenochaeta sp. DS3sAY3a]